VTELWFAVILTSVGYTNIPIQIGPFASQQVCERAIGGARAQMSWATDLKVLIPCWPAPPNR
jgi:hypothetical protein